MNEDKKIQRVGFISTRFQGTDGVSLETQKWSDVLERMGYKTYFFAGLSDWDEDRTMVAEEAFFGHPDILDIQAQCFGASTRTPELTRKIHEVKDRLKQELYAFLRRHQIDLIVPQNAVTIPMNIPLGLAITELIAETGIPTVAHHHDFFWERDRFLTNCIGDILAAAFPPPLPSVRHVTINSVAAREFSYRSGLSCVVIPNVLEFKAPAPGKDAYNADLRDALGLDRDDRLILQPTRIIARKGIERAIDLVARLDDPRVKLAISHQAGDEGLDYSNGLQAYARERNVPLIVRPDIIAPSRGRTPEGQKIYSLYDVYVQADLVTYPSLIEGFGNAFLETVACRLPIVVNGYKVFETDIAPLGFEVLKMNGYVTDTLVRQVRDLLDSPEQRERMTEKNYTLASQHFSYEVLARKLLPLMETRS